MEEPQEKRGLGWEANSLASRFFTLNTEHNRVNTARGKNNVFISDNYEDRNMTNRWRFQTASGLLGFLTFLKCNTIKESTGVLRQHPKKALRSEQNHVGIGSWRALYS